MPVKTYVSATDMAELVDNTMLAKKMFFPEFTDAEIEMARQLLVEKFTKTRTFEQTKNSVKMGMKAWIGMAWKRGDEAEEVC